MLPVGSNHPAAYPEPSSEQGSEVAAGYVIGGGCPAVVSAQFANSPTLTKMSWPQWRWTGSAFTPTELTREQEIDLTASKPRPQTT